MPNCPFCHAPIVWMGTSGGKRMPIDARLKDLFEFKSQWVKETQSGPEAVPTYSRVKGYTSHLSTCPHAERFSSNKKDLPLNTNKG
jgi:hypothetical protein